MVGPNNGTKLTCVFFIYASLLFVETRVTSVLNVLQALLLWCSLLLVKQWHSDQRA